MTASLVEVARIFVASETPNRRKRAEERIEALRKKYAPGGQWRLLQPGPLWEACEIWLEETRRFGHDIIDHVLKHPETPSHLGQSDEVEALRRFIYEWALQEQDEYIIPHFQAFIEERGIKPDVRQQQLGNTRARVQWHIAQITKEFLTRIFEAARAAPAATS